MTQFPDRFQSTPWPPAATDAQKSTNLEMKLTPKLTPAIPSGPVSTRPLKLPRYMQAPHSSARYLPSAREEEKLLVLVASQPFRKGPAIPVKRHRSHIIIQRLTIPGASLEREAAPSGAVSVAGAARDSGV